MNKKFFGKKVVKFGFVAFALALGLAACGDGGSSNGPANNHEDTNISSVESEENLPSCTESGEGFVNFINGTKEGFICKDRKWVHYDMIADVEENLPGCTGSREGLSAYLYEEDRELNCVEGSWDVVGEVASSSSSVIPGTDPESSSDEAVDLSYATKCPVGHTCTYAPTEYLNPKVTYGELLDERDYQMYKTVEICDDKNENCQTWMAQNLNYAYTGVAFDNGYYTSDSTSWCYDDDPSNCATYGRLYTWAAAVDSVAIYKNYGEECGYGKFCTRFSASALATAPVRGVCPSGWHLPSNAEWGALYTNVGGASYAGQKLKANTSLWTSYSGVTNDDSFGFSVLPAGYRNDRGSFRYRGYYAYFWSSTEYEYNGYNAWYQYFNYNGDYTYQNDCDKGYAFSVRCLKDSF
ncbi:major paralogous domain-containing protein [Fibrobacter sp. UWH9]|uniref:fibrobacter succinogenes major paralogous domain-containing protein n=1 Tax=Fibrobacter sp. UWH9 TaxID=1896213 RepID=UPI000915B904|nr:fibrobacter succinogenes major paralogous domain-containing protein [Fibrobacter sp. UWH9]SHH93982.1 major paralogous domain-containing protein [Fibrobacter sp. UWH9]